MADRTNGWKQIGKTVDEGDRRTIGIPQPAVLTENLGVQSRMTEQTGERSGARTHGRAMVSENRHQAAGAVDPDPIAGSQPGRRRPGPDHGRDAELPCNDGSVGQRRPNIGHNRSCARE